MIGTTLSHYRITDKLGEGGMGEVYRAHDERLDRDVAIKVLPEAVAKDADRLARFEREAKLLASLSHQNIATLHGLEEHDGQRFLVMELADGETLADRIKKGPIPVDDALPIALQIAEGLEAAHEQGIIHRDLKPANVMLSPEGKVKILDFGLAKAWQPEEDDAELTHSPTLTAQMTAAGVLLGTAAYMSPEQARGKPVDKRADIWAFGCVLWEMLTGGRLFTGDTVSDVLASVLKEAPDLEALTADTPAPVRRLLSRCLAKDPRDRLSSAGDARLDLRDSIRDSASEQVPAVPFSEARRTPRFVSLLVVAFLAAGAVGFLVWSQMQPGPEPVSRFVIQIPESDSLVHPGSALALSPDGRNLVYAAKRHGTVNLYSRPLDSLEARPLPGTEGARGPFFSPDGKWVGYWAEGSLKRVPLQGGPPARICGSKTFHGATWTADDTIYFAPAFSGLFCVPASGGIPEAVTGPDTDRLEVHHARPELVPNGDAVLFHIMYDDGSFDIAVKSLKTGEQRIVVDGGNNPRLLSSEHLLYRDWESGAIKAVRFDLDRLDVVGPATPVIEGVWYAGGPHLTVSRDGLLLYVPGEFSNWVSNNLVWLDRDRVVTRVTEDARPFKAPALSPDGTRVAVSEVSQEGGVSADIWVLELARGVWNRLTYQGNNVLPVWAPDGRTIYFSAMTPTWEVFSAPSDGSGEVRRLTESIDAIAFSVSPTGESLLVVQLTATEGLNLGLLRLDDGGGVEPLIATTFDEHTGEISPDGRWLAYVSNESGRDEIYVRPFPQVDANKWRVSAAGGYAPRWSADGSELFYRQGDLMMAVPIPEEPSLTLGRPSPVFEGVYLSSPGGGWDQPGWHYDVTADGQRFLMLQAAEDQGKRQINVVLNWFEELNRLVPTD
jgi:serine/threonine-protein kinase